MEEASSKRVVMIEKDDKRQLTAGIWMFHGRRIFATTINIPGQNKEMPASISISIRLGHNIYVLPYSPII